MSNQKRIPYEDIVRLNFKFKKERDTVYERLYGYSYQIITRKLAKRIYLDWEKPNGLCNMYKIDKDHNIVSTLPIRDLEHLEEIVYFFYPDERTR